MKNFLLNSLMSILLVGCCDTKEKSCPRGAMYTDFYGHEAPNVLTFMGNDSIEVNLDLGHSHFHSGGTTSWCPEDEEEPPCLRDYQYNYQGYPEGEDFTITIAGHEYSDEVMKISFSRAHGNRLGGLSIKFNPLDLTTSPGEGQVSEIGQVELNNIEYENVLFCQYPNDNEINDIYFSSEAGLIQFKLANDNTSVVYHRTN